MTPQQVWWAAAGSPSVEIGPRAARAAAVPVEGGPCAICGTHGQVLPASDVVSDGFTDWDRCPFARSDAVFCVSCAWSLRHRPCRTWPMVAHRDGTTDDTLAVLASPVDHTTAVSVPLSRQIHTAPFARWGSVATDRQHIEWTAADVDRLALLATLRTLGFTEPAFAEPSPRWVTLSRCPDRAWVLDAWEQLAPWRQSTDHLAVALRATRTPKTTKEGTTDDRGHIDAT